MLDRGIPAGAVEAICYGNALRAYEQSGQMKESDWSGGPVMDQSTMFEGNSVLRGQAPRVGSLAPIDIGKEEVLIK